MRIKILSNPNKEWAIELADYLKTNLRHEIVDKSEDVSIVIGGDGTFLYNKENIDGIAILIGSKTSKRAHINFNQEKYKFQDIHKKLDFLMRHLSYVELPLLKVSDLQCLSVNDVVLHSSNHSVVKIGVSSLYFSKVDEGDGVIISTPFGSLAYNRSVGGSEICLNIKALECSFISSITKSTPIVFPLMPLSLEVLEGEADLIVDGFCKTKFVKMIEIHPLQRSVKYYYNPLIKI